MSRSLGILRFRTGVPLPRARLAQCLGPGFRLGAVEQHRTSRIYLDTVDGRLKRAGRLLSSERGPRGATLVLVDLTEKERGSPEALELSIAPRFAAQLPEGRLAKKLRKLAGVRALLPRLRVESDEELVPVLDERDLRVAWIVQEQGGIHASDSNRKTPLPAVLELREVPDQQRAFRALERRLERLGLEPEERSSIAEALGALAKSPRRAAPRADAVLDPEAPAAATAGPILLPLLAAMAEHEEGTRLDLDPECLHDFRVALRRTRSAAKLLRPYLPPEAETLCDELRWFARLTSPVRDADVRLLRLIAFRDALPEGLWPGLASIASHVREQRQELRCALEAALEEPRYRALMRGWHKLLEQVPAAGARASTRELALSSLERLHGRALKSARRYTKGCETSELHELRLRCKDLRYAIEMFRSLFAEKRVDRALRSLALLQDDLGDFHDCELQIAELERLPSELAGKGDPKRALLAAGAMIEHLGRRRARALERSAEEIERFCSAKTVKRFLNDIPASAARDSKLPARTEP